MKKLKVGINGFGRIGRNATRIILERNDVEVVAVNSNADASSHAYLLKYDTTYGTLKNDIKSDGENLSIDGKKVMVFRQKLPSEIPWSEAGADIVIESTGKFRTKEDALGHLSGKVRMVVISAPAKDDTKTLVMGVNHEKFDPGTDKIISNSSCTTNCLATTVRVLEEGFGIKKGFMTTVHAVTDSQNLLDNSHKKEARLRRAAFANMIPASTGSAKDIGKLYPNLAGKLVCKALRVPLLTTSIVDLTVELKKETTTDDLNALYKKYSSGKLKNILGVATDELVSSDYTGTSFSSVVDTFLTSVQGNLAKVYAWYDNEWGYTNRLVDMVEYVGKQSGLL